MARERLIPDRRRKVDRTKYIRVGITAFLVLAAAVVLVFLFVKSEDVSKFFKDVRSALGPVIYGIVIAFLLTPVMNFFDRHLSHTFQKHAKKLTRAKKAAKAISIFLTLVIALALIALLFYLIVPEIANTVGIMVDELPKQVEGFMAWFNDLTESSTVFGGYLRKAVETATTYVEDIIENRLFSQISDIAQFLLTGVWDVVNVVYNFIIGFIFAVYVLASKDRFAAQAKKMTFSIFRRKSANTIIRIAKRCYAIFSGAIIGKVIDSAIIGLLCFVGMRILGLPYAIVISTFIGVTNVIPFFGPYIGAIPSALLILFVDPLQCLYFVIFIVLLQQFDCNILDPRIVGGSIGLSPFWVLFACIFFGGMFGLPGLVLGVPVFACIYMIVKEITEKRLRKRGLTTETDDYAGIDSLPEQEYVLVTIPGEEQGEASEEGTLEEAEDLGNAGPQGPAAEAEGSEEAFAEGQGEAPFTPNDR
ncbi:MAG: AI-2E family transporter [Lachnospiraceae bacterium]|nr:AI-2E family transporter [Lachnospiraceae bacterium]